MTLPPGSRLPHVSAAAVVVCMAVALAARADDARPIRVDYDVDEGCPTHVAFFAEVSARTSHARLAEPGEVAREFHVHVRRSGDVMLGRLEIGSAAAREIDAATCGEVVSALALVTALTIDPSASTAPLPPSAVAVGPSAPPAPVASSTAASVPRDTVPDRSRSGPPTTQSAPQRAQWTAGADFTVAVEMAPRPLVGGAAFLEFRPRGWNGPRARVSGGYATTGPFEAGIAPAVFTAAIGELEGCPVALSPARPISILPCVGLAGGALRGQGFQSELILRPREKVIPWLAAEIVGRFELALGELMFFETEAGPQFPLVRHDFFFRNPHQEVHTIPAIAWTLRSGVGVNVW